MPESGMRGPIGYCRTCGTIFEYPGLDVAGSRDISFRNVRVECPNGHEARLLDGTFDFMDDAVRLVAGPEFTQEIFERAIKLVVDSPADTTAGELAKKASEIHPALGKVIDRISSGDASKHGSRWKVAVAVGLAMLAMTRCSINLDLNRLVDQIRQPASGKSPPAQSQAPAPEQKKDQQPEDHERPKPPEERT
jgi:hypothetical protein